MAKLKFDFKKIDFTKIKQFLMAKGEKLALVSVAVLGGLLVSIGIWGAMSSDGKKKTRDLQANTAKIRSLIISDVPIDASKYDTDVKTAWEKRPSTFPFWQLVLLSEKQPPKRSSPAVKPVLVREDAVQFDYWNSAPIRIYSIDTETQKAEIVVTKGAGNAAAGGAVDRKELAETIAPRSMLVVTTFFPMNDQIEEFRKALRISREEELGPDHPQILGLCVKRVELARRPGADKDDVEWVQVGKEIDLFRADKDAVVPADHIKELLRRAHIDDEALRPFELHRVPNLMTLMPMLSHASYAPLKLKNFKSADDGAFNKKDKSKTPPVKGFDKGLQPAKKAPRDGVLDIVRWDDLIAAEAANPGFDPPQFPAKGGNFAEAGKLNSLVARFRGNFPVFDGQDTLKPELNKENPFDKPGLGKQFDKGKIPPRGESQLDPLVRFFDIDVEPGHTYQYRIAVRIRNPNVGKLPTEVARPEDADEPELRLVWAATGPFTVPEKADELHIYAMDKWEKKPPVHPCGPDTIVLDEKSNRAPVQIHSWFDEARYGDDRFVIVGWVIADRVLVRRGEYIGRKDLMVLAPTFNKAKGDFDVINPPRLPAEEKEKDKGPDKGGLKFVDKEKEKKKEEKKEEDKKFAAPPPSGINLDFTGTKRLLVDFDGGPRANKGGSGFNARTNLEESAFDLLILNPDGNLVVRNSHRDFNQEARIMRERECQERLNSLLSQQSDAPEKKEKGGGVNFFKK